MPQVITCILKDEKGKILILKRSKKVKTYKECWSGVSGYIEKNEKPIETAYKEIREETKLKPDQITLLKKYDPLEFTDIYKEKEYQWKVFPFLFKKNTDAKIIIDWENTEYKWIYPKEINHYKTVPKLKEIIKKINR